METAVENSTPRNKKINVLLIITAAFALIMLSVTSVLSYMLLNSSKVYKGVYINGQYVSGRDRTALEQLLEEKYGPFFDDYFVTLQAGESTLHVSFPELGVYYDTDSATQEAYSIGRSGGVFRRLFDIAQAGISGVSLNLPFSIREERLNDIVDRFYDMTFVSVKEGEAIITENNLTIVTGRQGKNIDRIKTARHLMTMVEELKTGILEAELLVTPPSKFDVDVLYGQIIRDPVDAYYRVEDSEPVLVPHITGRKIDKNRMSGIIKQNENRENLKTVLPISHVEPEITSETAETMLFRDELGSAVTFFATGTENGKNRAFNMGLAVQEIDEMILAPGQEFSFNEVVGPRSAGAGYKIAHVYSGGKIIDGIGGGICQVSSTIYNAVLIADLEVTERKNHSFTVAYVPLGQDATAFYGGTDLRFVNSTKWPIWLTASVGEKSISFSITGTDETPGKEVIISNNILKKTPYPVKYIDDPSLPAGTLKVSQEGMTGYVVETHKTIKIDGKVISQTKLHTSSYNAYDQIMIRGTKPEEIEGDGSADTSAADPGMEEPTGASGADPGAEEPTNTPEAGPGMEEPTNTPEAGPGAEEPTNTSEAGPGAGESTGTPEAGLGMEEPTNTSEAGPGMEEPTNTSETDPEG